VRSLLWLFDQLFVSINSHVSWQPYQLNPVMFCLSDQGLMAVLGYFGIYLETVKRLGGCLTVRNNVEVPNV